jgi:hypothetical protein
MFKNREQTGGWTRGRPDARFRQAMNPFRRLSVSEQAEQSLRDLIRQGN